MGLHTYICLDKVFGKRSAIGLGVLSRCRDFVGIVTMGAGDWCWPCGVCSGLVCVCGGGGGGEFRALTSLHIFVSSLHLLMNYQQRTPLALSVQEH